MPAYYSIEDAIAFTVIKPTSMSSDGLTIAMDKTLPTGLMVQLVIAYPDGTVSSVVSARTCPNEVQNAASDCEKNYLGFIEPTPEFLSAMIEIAQRENIQFVEDNECSVFKKNNQADALMPNRLQTTIV